MIARWRRVMAGRRLSERHVGAALTIAVGALSGLSAVVFALAIEGARRLFFGPAPGVTRLIAVPVLASVVAGWLLARVFTEARGSGIPQTKAAYHLRRGVVAARVAVGKFLTGVLCVGAGHSLGREGPSVQIGAGLASTTGRWLGAQPERVQKLVPVGASAALAAAFNTPIAAVLFSLEEVIGDMNAPMLGSTVVASVVSVIIARSILGNTPLFHVPAYQLVHPGELAAYAVLGVAGGLVSLVFTKALLETRRRLTAWPVWTVPWQPAVGGALIALVLLWRPEGAGVGYDWVDKALNGGLAWRLMAVLGAVKLVATVASYATGNAGGVFGPTLYLGAMLGGVVGIVTRAVAPFPVGDPGAYALVGMGTLFAGIIRAPMTSVFMIFEITQDYQIVVPLMVANLLAFAISRRYQRDPLYHALLKQDGVHLPDRHAPVSHRRWRVRDVMTTDYAAASGTATAGATLETLADDAAGVVLVDGEAFAGLVTRGRIEQAVVDGAADAPLSALSIIDPAHAHPDQGIDLAFDRVRRNQGVLPVLRRDDVSRLAGVVTHTSITQALRADAPVDPTSAVALRRPRG